MTGEVHGQRIGNAVRVHEANARAPVHRTRVHQVELRMVGGTVPLGTSLRTGAEPRCPRMREPRVDVLARGDRHGPCDSHRRRVDAVKLAILARECEQRAASARADQCRRGTHVPVVPVEATVEHLDVVEHSPSSRVQRDDAVRVEIRSLAKPRHEIRRRVPGRNIEDSLLRIEREAAPHPSARRRRRARGRGPRSAGCARVGDDIEAPHLTAGCRVESVDVSAHTDVVAAGVADEYEAVPCDRCNRCTLALAHTKTDIPQHAARGGIECIRVNPAVHAEETAVHVSHAVVVLQEAHGLVRAHGVPDFAAGRGVDRVRARVGRHVQHAADDHRSALHRHVLAGVERTRALEVGGVGRRDLCQRRVSRPLECAVVRRPVGTGGRRGLLRCRGTCATEQRDQRPCQGETPHTTILDRDRIALRTFHAHYGTADIPRRPVETSLTGWTVYPERRRKRGGTGRGSRSAEGYRRSLDRADPALNHGAPSN